MKRPLTTPSCRRALLLPLAGAASIAAALFLGGAAPANATPPGSNGLISYRVYFNADHTEGALFVANPDGSNATQITFPGAGNLDTNQNWSPSGQQLVYEHDTADGSSSIWTVGALGANPQEIVPCPGPGVLADCAGVSNPSWSPNGQWIAFELVLGPFDPSGNPADDSIWAVRPNGSGLRQITHRTPSGPRRTRIRSGHPIRAGSPSSATTHRTSTPRSGRPTRPPAVTWSGCHRRAFAAATIRTTRPTAAGSCSAPTTTFPARRS
ncbi:MAG TPA: hypothetical protein VKB73_04400 [Gaiellaceae bacterium]|nr:hypothetical protein [Gaiellaceae bacterium]